MQYDYEVIAFAYFPQETSALMSELNSYYATADLDPKACNPPNDYALLSGTTTATATASPELITWATGSSTPATGIVNGGFVFGPASAIYSRGTEGALTLFFISTQTSTSALNNVSISITKVLADGTALYAAIKPPGNIKWTPALSAGTTQGTLKFAPANAGIYFVKLAQLMRSPSLLRLSQVAVGSLQSPPTIYLQAFSCGIAAGKTFRNPTLHTRKTPHRDMHDVYDIGAIIPSVKSLQRNKRPASTLSATAGNVTEYYVVSRFEVKDPAASPLIIHSTHTHFCSGDTSIASATLLGKVRVDVEPVAVVSNMNAALQPYWQNASNLATASFSVSEGFVSNTIAVFFTPLTFLDTSTNDAGVPTLAATTSTIQINDINSAASVEIQLPGNAVGMTAGNWTLSIGGADSSLLTLTAIANAPPLPIQLPYIEFTYFSSTGSSPPTIATITSSAIPMQGLSASTTLAASASTATPGTCFSYDQVKAAGVILFTDAYGNAYKFGDPDASFTLENASLNLVQGLNSHYADGYGFNQGQTVPPVDSNSIKFVEKRTVDGGAWYIVDEVDPSASSAPAGQYAPTRYSFVSASVAAGSAYAAAGSAVGSSIILLYAQNTTTGGIPAESGFVSCDTAGAGGGFAATAKDFTAPLLTLAQAQQQGIQWGVVQKNVDLTSTSLGASAAEPRSIGLVYRDNVVTTPTLLSIAVPPPAGDSLPYNLAAATNPPRGVTGMAGTWIAHGVWTQTPPQNDDNAWSAEVLYNPDTMLVETIDKYNIVTGSGFTAVNTHIQWICRQPVFSSAEVSAGTIMLQTCRQAIKDTGAQIASIVLLAHEQLLALPPQSTSLAIATESFSVLTHLTLQAQAEIQRALGSARLSVANAILDDLQTNILRNVQLRQASFLASTILSSVRTTSSSGGGGSGSDSWKRPVTIVGIVLGVILVFIIAVVFIRRRMTAVKK